LNKIRNIERTNNSIIINRMDHPSCVSDFMRSLYDGISRGFTDIKIISSEVRAFPNACVPIAGIIDYYAKNGINFTFQISESCYLNNCGFITPYEMPANDIESLENPFDKIFRYNESSQVASLTQAYIDTLSHFTQCNQGVVDGIIWCINEVMDNVLVHGECEYGFIMSQFHPHTNRIAFCVFDSGIGIYNSLKNSKHHPRNSLDAISLSVQEGVGDGKGQGNGLYGLQKIVEDNGGNLTITSGPSSLMMLRNGDRNTFTYLPYLGRLRQGTTVDFQLDIKKNINLQQAFSSIGGFDAFDIRIDDMMQENNLLLYDVFDNCTGTATREAGLLLRNDVFNLLQRSNCPIIIDFSKVSSVSSSFIDEFISKLFVQLGVVLFNQSVRIKGMNNTIKYLCDRSSYMRIHSMWENRDESIDSFDKLFE
jgi:hypothetical protein